MKKFSFGLFADCQYADKKNVGRRYYKRAAKKLQECINTFNHSNLEFVVNLGDLIDESFYNFKRVLDITSHFDGNIYHLVGNHDYNVEDHEKENVLKILNITHPYYSFTVENWRFIIIDGTEISLFRYPAKSPEYMSAKEFHSKRAPDSAEWNGAVGKVQMDWLVNELTEAQIAEENVIIFSHFPVYPKNPHNLWNAEDFSFIQDYDCVKAFISGHNHNGNYATLDGKHYLCLRAVVDTKNKNAFCIVDVHEDKVVIKGFGREEGKTLMLT
ncbi:MAG: metallophosphoesterase [Candidatus Hodarchaeota archaeon]